MNSTVEQAYELGRVSASLIGEDRVANRQRMSLLVKMTGDQTLWDYYYDGRLFTLFTIGEEVRKKPIGRMMDFHFRRHMPRVFTGEASKSRYSVGLVDFMVKWGIYGHDPREFQVE